MNIHANLFACSHQRCIAMNCTSCNNSIVVLYWRAYLSRSVSPFYLSLFCAPGDTRQVCTRVTQCRAPDDIPESLLKCDAQSRLLNVPRSNWAPVPSILSADALMRDASVDSPLQPTMVGQPTMPTVEECSILTAYNCSISWHVCYIRYARGID